MINTGGSSINISEDHQALQGKLYSKCTNHHPADEAEKQRCLAKEHWNQTVKTHIVSLKGSFFREGAGYNLTKKRFAEFLHVFQLILQISLCKSMHCRYLICMYCAYDLDQKNAGS